MTSKKAAASPIRSAATAPGESWLARLRAQGVTDAMIEEARTSAAAMAAAADGIAFDLGDPPDSRPFDLTRIVTEASTKGGA